MGPNLRRNIEAGLWRLRTNIGFQNINTNSLRASEIIIAPTMTFHNPCYKRSEV